MSRLAVELSEVLRPALPGVGEAIIDAIRDEVPDYARPLKGTFGREVHRGVEVALRRFIDEVAAKIDETELRRAQQDKDAVRAYELVYAALGA